MRLSFVSIPLESITKLSQKRERRLLKRSKSPRFRGFVRFDSVCVKLKLEKMSATSEKLRESPTFSFGENEEFQNLVNEIKRGAKIISLAGLTSNSSKALLITILQQVIQKSVTLVLEKNSDLETWENDVGFFCRRFNSEPTISILPSAENDVYAGVSPHPETLEERALSLWNLANQGADIILTTSRSLITRTIKPFELKELGAFVKVNKDFAPEILIEKLIASGYSREEPVKAIGDFSSRGGIIDVWSPNNTLPVRLEFFGDTVDSIREFNAETQLSVQKLSEIEIAPMREFSAKSNDFKDWTFFAAERFSDGRFGRALKDRTQFAIEGEDFAGWENLFPLFQPRTASLFDYLKDTIIIVDEPTNIELSLESFYENLENRYSETDEADDIGLAPNELFLTPEELREKLSTIQRIELRALGRGAAETDEEFQIN